LRRREFITLLGGGVWVVRSARAHNSRRCRWTCQPVLVR
jgi:hypothetical protein